MDHQSPIDSDVRAVINGLGKSGMTRPMKKSATIPRRPFMELFQSWPDNDMLSTERLRLKSITLMALALMLRPSDIAPRAVTIQDGHVINVEFTTDRITFLDNGSAEIYLFSIKNDYERDGSRVYLMPCSIEKLCPVKALRCLVQRGGKVNPNPVRPVFTPLNYPFSSLSAATITSMLNASIKLAGLDGMGLSAKSFRPTRVTVAIEGGLEPERIMNIGRWRSKECFDKHYVHAYPQEVTG